MKVLREVGKVLLGLFLLILFALVLRAIPSNYLSPDTIDPHAAFLAALIIPGFKFIEGILLGHLMRKTILYYVDFRSEREWSNNVLVIVFYALGVWACVVGG